jgi:hypothetical protein
MNKFLVSILAAQSYLMAFDCPTNIKMELTSAEQYLYETTDPDALGVSTKTNISGDLNELKIYEPLTYMNYTIPVEFSPKCEWSETSAKFLTSVDDEFFPLDSTLFQIYRDDNKIQISENSFLPMGDTPEHFQWVDNAGDTVTNGLTEDNGSYYINGKWLGIELNTTEIWYGITYASKVGGNKSTFNGSFNTDSSKIVTSIVNSVKNNINDLDTLYLQMVKLKYTVTEDSPVSNLDVAKNDLSINELGINLPLGTQWVKVFDLKGKLLIERNMKNTSYLSLNNLNKGIYFIQTDNNLTRKLYIEN